MSNNFLWNLQQELELETVVPDSIDPISAESSDPLFEASYATDPIKYDVGSA